MYLEDIQTAMSRIAEYIEELTFADFKKDYKTVDAVIRNFEVIGEASKNLPTEFKEKYNEIPWTEMYLSNSTNIMSYFKFTHPKTEGSVFTPLYL